MKKLQNICMFVCMGLFIISMIGLSIGMITAHNKLGIISASLLCMSMAFLTIGLTIELFKSE